jgi:hypothetical protein
MQRSAYKWIAIAVLAWGLSACADEGVGDPCIPERIPCKGVGDAMLCGYDQTESYIESSSVQCRSRLCIVHKLDNGNNTVGDPTKLCTDDKHESDPTCVPPEALDDSVYCTCRCGGPKTSVEFCECPSGFECQEVLNLGGDGIKGSYCVRPKEE